MLEMSPSLWSGRSGISFSKSSKMRRPSISMKQQLRNPGNCTLIRKPLVARMANWIESIISA